MQKVKNYVRESFAELQKVTWPTTEELKGSTYVVVVFSILMSAFVWGADFVLTKLFEAVLGA
jgi:preprotein translocase subunit SecE